MTKAEFFRILDAEEAAKVAPLPVSDAETPTTSLTTATSKSTASVHFSGDAPAAQFDAAIDVLPDPVEIRKEK